MNININLDSPEEILYEFITKAEKIIDEKISKMKPSEYNSLLKEIKAMPKDYSIIYTLDYIKAKYSAKSLDKADSILSSGELDLLMDL